MIHEKIVLYKLREYNQLPNITGMLVMGSNADDTATVFSDLDLLVLCDKNEFIAETIDGVFTETTYLTKEKAYKNLENKPMDLYHYLNSKIMLDKNRHLYNLVNEAQFRYDNYITSHEEKVKIKHWLISSKIKIESAMSKDDILNANYITATNSWKIIEAVWALNNKPVPPSSSVIKWVSQLKSQPFVNWFDKLFSRSDIEKMNSFVKIIDWSVEKI